MTPRETLISNIANKIISNLADSLKDSVYKVAIDGYDGAGKTTFADELVIDLKSKKVNVIRSSSDFFHNPRSVRYKLGKGSPEGYFRDSFNYPKLKELLLDPISEGGSGLYRTQYFNHKTDQIEESFPQKVKENSILVFDGIFLHRDELRQYWDYSIFLDVTRAESLRRCFVRDGSGSSDINAPENRRYVLGQKLYFDKCNPSKQASFVIDNS